MSPPAFELAKKPRLFFDHSQTTSETGDWQQQNGPQECDSTTPKESKEKAKVVVVPTADKEKGGKSAARQRSPG